MLDICQMNSTETAERADQVDFDTLVWVGRTVQISTTWLQQRAGHLNVVMREVKQQHLKTTHQQHRPSLLSYTSTQQSNIN